MNMPRHSAMGNRARYLDAAISGKAGDEDEADRGGEQRNRLDPGGPAPHRRRRRLNDEPGKQ